MVWRRLARRLAASRAGLRPSTVILAALGLGKGTERSLMAIPKVTIPKEVFRERLEAERQRLVDELAAQDRNGVVSGQVVGGEHAGYGNHLADDASDLFEQEKNLALQQNLKDLLAKVEHALRKFDAGTYGVCEGCGEAMDPARLEALPWAALCVRCKQKVQKRP
jgi:DnaK suppressor protein